MLTKDAASSYRSQAVQTASGPQLLVMLYDRMALDIEQAVRSISGGNLFEANEAMQHAQQILIVLKHSLDPNGFSGGYDLLALYDFLSRKLVEANLHKDQRVLMECAQIVAPLREAWHRAVLNPA